MSLPLLKVAIVGHTNAGKTSLVRTLTHNRQFGEVADRGGTTRQVTSTLLGADSEHWIELFDSPGLENAPELIEFLDTLPGQRHDGPDRVRQFLRDGHGLRFDQEARVLELLLDTDVALYVIDAREPVLEKYLDELAVLGLCGKPLIAVLNFTASSSNREEAWREALSRLALHTVLAFDAAIRDPATERRLFEKLKSQLDPFSPTLDAWLAEREREEQQRLKAALMAIADLLVDAAACRRSYRLDNDQQRQQRLDDIRQAVRRREQVCVEALLDLYRFGYEDFANKDLPLDDGQWSEDLFDPQTLAHHGMKTGQYLGAGAGAGALFDISTGGLSLGAGTLVGSLAGADTGLFRTVGRQAVARARGRGLLGIDDGTLRLLAWRQLKLLSDLISRGHASPHTLRPETEDRWKHKRLPAALRRARHHPKWSSLNPGTGSDPDRANTVEALAGVLETAQN
jgi:hypothetical protein